MRRVLVAEDDEGTRTLLSAVLRKEGYEVKECGDGLEAVRVGSRELFDLVILDLEAPGARWVGGVPPHQGRAPGGERDDADGA